MTSEEAVKIIKKNDAPYLNSKARVAKKILISLLEYVVIILLTLMLASYMESGTIDNMFNMNESMMEMLQPGGFIFNSLVTYLPILILVNLSSYFGSGSKAKLLIGVLKCVAIALWLTVLLDSAATSIEIPSIAEGQGLDSIEIGIKGLAKFATFIVLVSVLVPIGEYIGAYKKHKSATERKKNDYAEI